MVKYNVIVFFPGHYRSPLKFRNVRKPDKLLDWVFRNFGEWYYANFYISSNREYSHRVYFII